MTLGTGVARGLSGAARNLMPWLASIGAHGQGSGFYFVLKLVVVARRLAPSPHSFTDASNVLTAPSSAMSCSLSGQFVGSCGACSLEKSIPAAAICAYLPNGATAPMYCNYPADLRPSRNEPLCCRTLQFMDELNAAEADPAHTDATTTKTAS